MEKSYSDLIGSINLQRTYAERYRVSKTDADRERYKAGYLILKAEVEDRAVRLKKMIDFLTTLPVDDNIDD